MREKHRVVAVRLPSPLWGGVGGGGSEILAPQLPNALPPSPALPHKGGGSTPSLSFECRSYRGCWCEHGFRLRVRHLFALPLCHHGRGEGVADHIGGRSPHCEKLI